MSNADSLSHRSAFVRQLAKVQTFSVILQVALRTSAPWQRGVEIYELGFSNYDARAIFICFRKHGWNRKNKNHFTRKHKKFLPVEKNFRTMKSSIS